MNRSQSTELNAIIELFGDYLEAGYRRQPTSDAAGAPAAPGPSAGDRRPAAAAGTGEATEDRAAGLKLLEQSVRACTLCALHQGRMHAVPGVGVLDPLVMVIGEGPGAEEDAKGEPFVGAAGRYLDKWLAAVDLSRRSNVYITNIVKCRPPNNRDPLPNESQACAGYLARQIELVRPRVILSVGRVATQLLLESQDGIGKLRGGDWVYRDIPVVPTYHPSAVLRNDQWRRPVWEDLKRLRRLLDGT
ncbi:MAG: uracil-DNA glycosylase [Spirochaetaceae bacterium]|nr:MAG: uracil-DNA glycosylase [Spirochaetaceae bacterium]